MRRLRRASAKGQVAGDEVTRLAVQAEELGRMLGGFIDLRQSGFRDRGRFRASQSRRD